MHYPSHPSQIYTVKSTEVRTLKVTSSESGDVINNVLDFIVPNYCLRLLI